MKVFQFLLIATLAFELSPAAAQRYPVKPIRMVTAGGPDALPRLLAQKFTEAWGQQVVIDAHGGGGGLMSASIVAKAAPDGYTLLITTGTHTMGPNVFKLPYDLMRDFAPVALAAKMPFILSVHPSIPVTSVRELIDYAKAHPRELNYGSGGNGSPGHLITEMFNTMAGVKLVHVPYKSVANAVTALIAKEVEVMFTVSPSAVPQMKAGRIRGLALSTLKRSPTVPDMPTVAEAGLAGFDASAWNGLVVPAGTPQRIIVQLQDETLKALKAPDVLERIALLGFEPAPMNAQESGEFLKAELAKWAKVARDAGVKAE
jgi:tripartite-type tricarboxylate transporter receptor subunit TctC